MNLSSKDPGRVIVLWGNYESMFDNIDEAKAFWPDPNERNLRTYVDHDAYQQLEQKIVELEGKLEIARECLTDLHACGVAYQCGHCAQNIDQNLEKLK